MSKPTGKLIRLTAGDVGAYRKTEADTKVAMRKKRVRMLTIMPMGACPHHAKSMESH
ncbi:hypothetical protein AB6F55_19535 [Providencia hangzhouensis]